MLSFFLLYRERESTMPRKKTEWEWTIEKALAIACDLARSIIYLEQVAISIDDGPQDAEMILSAARWHEMVLRARRILPPASLSEMLRNAR